MPSSLLPKNKNNIDSFRLVYVPHILYCMYVGTYVRVFRFTIRNFCATRENSRRGCWVVGVDGERGKAKTTKTFLKLRKGLREWERERYGESETERKDFNDVLISSSNNSRNEIRVRKRYTRAIYDRYQPASPKLGQFFCFRVFSPILVTNWSVGRRVRLAINFLSLFVRFSEKSPLARYTLIANSSEKLTK